MIPVVAPTTESSSNVLIVSLAFRPRKRKISNPLVRRLSFWLLWLSCSTLRFLIESRLIPPEEDICVTHAIQVATVTTVTEALEAT